MSQKRRGSSILPNSQYNLNVRRLSGGGVHASKPNTNMKHGPMSSTRGVGGRGGHTTYKNHNHQNATIHHNGMPVGLNENDEERGRFNNHDHATLTMDGIYSDESLTNALFLLEGTNVRVNTTHGKVYEGILTTWSGDMELALELVHEVLKCSNDIVLIEKKTFKMEEIVSCEGLDNIKYIQQSSEINCSVKNSGANVNSSWTFKTDADISSSSAPHSVMNGLSKRKGGSNSSGRSTPQLRDLESWNAGGNEGSTVNNSSQQLDLNGSSNMNELTEHNVVVNKRNVKLTLDEPELGVSTSNSSSGGGGGGSYTTYFSPEEMFRRNEVEHGVKSSFKENLEQYTSVSLPSENDSENYSELKAKAEMYAREIEAKNHYHGGGGGARANSYHQGHGQRGSRNYSNVTHPSSSSPPIISEEDAYSAVVRVAHSTTSSHSTNWRSNSDQQKHTSSSTQHKSNTPYHQQRSSSNTNSNNQSRASPNFPIPSTHNSNNKYIPPNKRKDEGSDTNSSNTSPNNTENKASHHATEKHLTSKESGEEKITHPKDAVVTSSAVVIDVSATVKEDNHPQDIVKHHHQSPVAEKDESSEVITPSVDSKESLQPKSASKPLNIHAKEFTLNPNAKVFVPSPVLTAPAPTNNASPAIPGVQSATAATQQVVMPTISFQTLSPHNNPQNGGLMWAPAVIPGGSSPPTPQVAMYLPPGLQQGQVTPQPHFYCIPGPSNQQAIRFQQQISPYGSPQMMTTSLTANTSDLMQQPPPSAYLQQGSGNSQIQQTPIPNHPMLYCTPGVANGSVGQMNPHVAMPTHTHPTLNQSYGNNNNNGAGLATGGVMASGLSTSNTPSPKPQGSVNVLNPAVLMDQQQPLITTPPPHQNNQQQSFISNQLQLMNFSPQYVFSANNGVNTTGGMGRVHPGPSMSPSSNQSMSGQHFQPSSSVIVGNNMASNVSPLQNSSFVVNGQMMHQQYNTKGSTSASAVGIMQQPPPPVLHHHQQQHLSHHHSPLPTHSACNIISPVVSGVSTGGGGVVAIGGGHLTPSSAGGVLSHHHPCYVNAAPLPTATPPVLLMNNNNINPNETTPTPSSLRRSPPQIGSALSTPPPYMMQQPQ